jgi:hypothetical protein
MWVRRCKLSGTRWKRLLRHTEEGINRHTLYKWDDLLLAETLPATDPRRV